MKKIVDLEDQKHKTARMGFVLLFAIVGILALVFAMIGIQKHSSQEKMMVWANANNEQRCVMQCREMYMNQDARAFCNTNCYNNEPVTLEIIQK